MRTLNTAGLALLARLQAGEQIPVVKLVWMDLTEPQYLTTAGRVVVWDGHDWQPAGLGHIDAIEDAAGQVNGLQFSLPGVTQEQIYIALQEPTDGQRVRVWDAILDPDTGEVGDAIACWSGRLNLPGLEDGPEATVTLTAEHAGVLALRPKPARYTNDEQQRRYPGDTSLDIDPATDAGPIAWPAASFFRQ